MQNVSNLSVNKDDSDETKLMFTKALFQATISKISERFFFCYMNLFQQYLITRFARENKDVEVHDDILERTVPNIVFILNQRHMKEIMHRKIQNDNERQKMLILQSQVNEQYYSMLKECGVASQLDQSISGEFMHVKSP